MTSAAMLFWTKVEAPHGCWLWKAGRDSYGYGVFRANGRQTKAHRFIYELFKGSIPQELEIDHICRNKLCVNPAHLRAVTHRENLLNRAPYKLRTHCRAGHPWNSTNTRIDTRGRRYCNACHKVTMREFYIRKKRTKTLENKAKVG